MTPRSGEISPQGASDRGGTEPVERNRLRPRRGEENRRNGPRSGLRPAALRRRYASAARAPEPDVGECEGVRPSRLAASALGGGGLP